MPLLITRESPVTIGTTDRSTNRLIAGKKWIFEQAPIVAHFAAIEPFYSAIVKSIATWQPAEGARLLMYLAAADAKELLLALEAIDAPLMNLAKLHPNYRHVRLYKLLGFRGYRNLMPLAAMVRRVLQ